MPKKVVFTPLKFRRKNPLMGAISMKKYRIVCKETVFSQFGVTFGKRLEYFDPTTRRSKKIRATNRNKNSVPTD